MSESDTLYARLRQVTIDGLMVLGIVVLLAIQIVP